MYRAKSRGKNTFQFYTADMNASAMARLKLEYSLHRALMKLADAYPDKTGQNTAISGAMNVQFTQVFVVHGEPKVAAAPEGKKTASVAAAHDTAGHE